MEKNKLVEAFLTKLFEPEKRRLDLSIERLDRENRHLLGSTEYGFMWQGQWFLPKSAPHIPARVPALDFSLRESGNFLLRDMKQVKDDEQLIRQTVWLLVKDCVTEGDLRDALPDSLVELSPKLNELPRMREAGFTLQMDRHKRQFQKALNKIDLYVATRLMY